MGKKDSKSFAAEHGHESSTAVDAAVRKKLEQKAREGNLTCAAAFQLAADLQQSPSAVGKAADLLGIRLVKCQLGLFGYAPEKKIVRAAETVDPELEDAIRGALQDGRLPCRLAWELAKRYQVPKMGVSAACETLGIKVRPCQLGAF